MAADVRVLFGLSPDTNSIKKTTKTIDKAMDKSAEKTVKTFSAASKKIRASFSNVAPTGASRRTTSTASAQDADFGRVSKEVALLGDAESNINAIGGALGTLGGEAGIAAEGLLRVGAEIFATAEAAPKLVASLKGAPAALKAAAANTLGVTSATVAKTTATQAEAVATTGATITILGLNVALWPLALAAAAVAATLAVFAIGIKLTSDASEKAAEEVEEQRVLQQQYAESLSSTSEEIETQIDDINTRLAEIQLGKTFEEGIIAAEKSTNAFDAFFGGIGDALGSTGAAGDQASESLEKLNDEEINLIAQSENLARSLGSSEVAANDAEAAEEGLIKERDRAKSAIASLSAEESKLIADRADKQAVAAEDQAIKDARSAEDLAEANKKSADRLLQIHEDGSKSIQEAVKDGNDELKKIVASGQKARRDELSDFAKEQDKLRTDFAKADLERQKKNNEAKAKAQQSFEDEQFDAVQNNDIIAIQRAQRRFDTEQSERESEFQKVQAAERKEAETRIRVLQEESQARLNAITAGIQMEITAAKLATREKIANEKRALAETLANEKKAQAEADKQRAKQTRRQAEDQALREKREREAFEQRLKEIEDKKSAEQQALGAVLTTLGRTAQGAINLAGQAAVAMVRTVGNIAQTVINQMASQASGRSSRSFLGRELTRRASGGRVSSGRLFQVNDATRSNPTEFFRPDTSGRIIPMAGNIAGAGRGAGGGTIVNIDLTVGDIATGQQVLQAIRGAARQTGQIDVQVVGDSLAGVG